MAIESNAVVISELNSAYPQDKDYISEGAAHMRLVKQVLKNTVPGFDKPVTISADKLNEIDKALEVDDSSVDFNGRAIINATVGTSSSDLITRLQVQGLINSMLSDRVYRVGSYYMSDDNTPPNDPSVLGFGQWERIVGAVFGAGTVIPDGSVPNASAKTFSVGDSGGRVYNTIKLENLPRVDVPFSATTTSYTHSHTTQTGSSRADANTHDRGGQLASTRDGGNNDNPNKNFQSSVDTHNHTLTGSIGFGQNDVSRQPIDTTPPFRVTNIWRRTA